MSALAPREREDRTAGIRRHKGSQTVYPKWTEQSNTSRPTDFNTWSVNVQTWHQIGIDYNPKDI